MTSSAAPAPSSSAPSFAGLLAAFSDPERKFPPARDNDGLTDDVATLSYEHALRTHARYRPATAPARPAKPAESSKSQSLFGASDQPPEVAPVARRAGPTPVERNLKRASITIRLSQSECAQLHQRAAEAGLTVSAYLRSCTLEVENLRAQVKETLVQLRSATSAPQNMPAEAPNRFWSRWRLRLRRTPPA